MIKDRWTCLLFTLLFPLTATAAEVEIVKNRIDINSDGYDSLHLEPMTHSEARGLLPFRVESYKNGVPVGKSQNRAKRRISKGQILTTGMIEKIPVLEPGREVSIVYKTPGIEISAPGVALESGYTGEIIRVKNRQSRKIVSCTIINDGTVQVALH